MSTVQPIPGVRIRYGVKGGLGVSELIVEVGQSWRTAATARYPWIWDPANLLMRIMMILIMMATIYDDQENFWRCNSKFEGICVKKIWFIPHWRCCYSTLGVCLFWTLGLNKHLIMKANFAKGFVGFLFCANLFFYSCTFLCLAGQKNHLRQEVLFVQTAAFREAVREGGFERKAPIKEKPQLFLKTTTNIGCKI